MDTQKKARRRFCGFGQSASKSSADNLGRDKGTRGQGDKERNQMGIGTAPETPSHQKVVGVLNSCPLDTKNPKFRKGERV